MLSHDANRILKLLNAYEKQFMRGESKTIKVSDDELKAIFPNKSHMQLITTLQYLLEERYMYNHLAKSPNMINFDNVDYSKLAIGERGIAYLQQKKYKLLAQILPLTFSGISLAVAFLSILN